MRTAEHTTQKQIFSKEHDLQDTRITQAKTFGIQEMPLARKIDVKFTQGGMSTALPCGIVDEYDQTHKSTLKNKQ